MRAVRAASRPARANSLAVAARSRWATKDAAVITGVPRLQASAGRQAGVTTGVRPGLKSGRRRIATSGECTAGANASRCREMQRHGFDDDRLSSGAHAEVRAVVPAHRDRDLDLLVDHALEEPRAERDAVALRREQLQRVFVDLDRLAGPGHRLLEIGQMVPRDA